MFPRNGICKAGSDCTCCCCICNRFSAEGWDFFCCGWLAWSDEAMSCTPPSSVSASPSPLPTSLRFLFLLPSGFLATGPSSDWRFLPPAGVAVAASLPPSALALGAGEAFLPEPNTSSALASSCSDAALFGAFKICRRFHQIQH